MLIFDEATSSLDQNTAEHFALTINQLKGQVGMLFITHAMPKNLLVDEIVRIGQGSLSAVATTKGEPAAQASQLPPEGHHAAYAAPNQTPHQGAVPHSQEQNTEGRMEG